jgi:hypothetical protein
MFNKNCIGEGKVKLLMGLCDVGRRCFILSVPLLFCLQLKANYFTEIFQGIWHRYMPYKWHMLIPLFNSTWTVPY